MNDELMMNIELPENEKYTKAVVVAVQRVVEVETEVIPMYKAHVSQGTDKFEQAQQELNEATTNLKAATIRHDEMIKFLQSMELTDEEIKEVATAIVEATQQPAAEPMAETPKEDAKPKSK